MKIYQCFRTGASQSIHNMCGSRNFYRGEGGWSRPDGKKTALTAFSVCLFCVALKLLTEVFQRGSFIFQGSIFFQGGGGSEFNFYRNPYITCDFLSPPPLDPRMHNNLYSSCSSLLKRQKSPSIILPNSFMCWIFVIC